MPTKCKLNPTANHNFQPTTQKQHFDALPPSQTSSSSNASPNRSQSASLPDPRPSQSTPFPDSKDCPAGGIGRANKILPPIRAALSHRPGTNPGWSPVTIIFLTNQLPAGGRTLGGMREWCLSGWIQWVGLGWRTHTRQMWSWHGGDSWRAVEGRARCFGACLARSLALGRSQLVSYQAATCVTARA